MNGNSDIRALLQERLRGDLSPERQQAFHTLLHDQERQEELRAALEELMSEEQTILQAHRSIWTQHIEAILSLDRDITRPLTVSRPKVIAIPWVRAVAAAVLILGIAMWWLTRFQLRQEAPAQQLAINIPAPTGNHATLTLAGGRQLVLDTAANGGTLATQGSAQVSKTADGQITYHAPEKASGPVVYNTLTNPRGSQVISITLADGSRVWLNAGSSLTYPASWPDNARNVSVNGEAYFEVAKDIARPFSVSKTSGGKEAVRINVLGTNFNVNAYEDETTIRVTLLQGAVKVSSDINGHLLQPGQQLRISPNGTQQIAATVDLDEVMAWKNGRFQFDGVDMQTLMRQISRWYDVEVQYEGKFNPADYAFVGNIRRTENMAKVLHILELGGVHFRAEGRKLIVLP